MSAQVIGQVRVITTTKAGDVNVFTEGDLSVVGRPNILTVHDMGSNHKSWQPFISHPSMEKVRQRCNFIHIVVPGQDDNADNFPSSFPFPPMDDLAAAVSEVIDELKVGPVVGMGEGVGANILARCAIARPDQYYCLVLIHCTSSKAGVKETLKDKYMKWKLETGKDDTAEQYLVFHKFGYRSHTDGSNKEDTAMQKVIQEYADHLKTNMNVHNVMLFVECFRCRDDISSRLHQLTVRTFLVTGENSSHAHTVETMYHHCKGNRDVEMLTIPHVGDVITEAPAQLAESVILFLQGSGLLPSLHLPERKLPADFLRRASMPEADVPKPHRIPTDDCSGQIPHDTSV